MSTFNDLIRKGNKTARLIVVDPNLDAVVNLVCQTLGHHRTHEYSLNVEGLACKVDGRITFVKAKAEELSSAHISALLRMER
jgi:hypothetical protein